MLYSCGASNLYSLNYHIDRLPEKSCQTQTLFTDDKLYFAGPSESLRFGEDTGSLLARLSLLLYERETMSPFTYRLGGSETTTSTVSLENETTA